MSLTTPSVGYKPFKYPWCFDAWQTQQRVHWLPEEVPMADDVTDWGFRLTESEKNLLTQIFRYFTQGDVEVANCYHDHYLRVFKPVEVKMMLTAFANMETVHIAAYALLLETIGMPDTEFSAFMEYDAMAEKSDYMKGFRSDDPYQVALTLAAFGAFTEGLSLFASFAMLMNFPRRNRMKGMGQIVSWSVRDENMHCENIIGLHHTWVHEHPEIDRARLQDDLLAICRAKVEQEDKFIDLAFAMGPVEGMTSQEVKSYVRYVANWRCRMLNIPEPYSGVTANPLPWLDALLSGREHANFFEARATEYSKASATGVMNDSDW